MTLNFLHIKFSNIFGLQLSLVNTLWLLIVNKVSTGGKVHCMFRIFIFCQFFNVLARHLKPCRVDTKDCLVLIKPLRFTKC